MATKADTSDLVGFWSLDMVCQSKVLSYLAMKDAAKFAMSSTTARALIRALRNFHPEIGDTVPKKLHGAIWDLWCGLRPIALHLRLREIRPETMDWILSHKHMSRPSLEVQKVMPNVYHDIFLVHGVVWSQFFEDYDLSGGIFHRFLSIFAHDPMRTRYQPKIMEDAPNWIRNCVFGQFYVFRKSDAGVIYVHSQTLRVYVVKCTVPGDYVDVGTSESPLLVRTTLYTLLNRYIVSDTFYHVMPLKYPAAAPALLRNLHKIYMRAVDSGEIYVSSCLEPYSKSGVGAPINLETLLVPSDKREEAQAATVLKLLEEYPRNRNRREVDVTGLRAKYASQLNDLKMLPTLEGEHGIWLVRRLAYSEEENYKHQISLLSNSGMYIGVDFTAKLEPTIDEYIALIHKYCGAASGAMDSMKFHKPHRLLCDVMSVVCEVKALLEPLGVEVVFYPPPHDAEAELYSQETMPFLRHFVSACFVCLEQSKDLNRCARCRNVIYCSREHQRMDWGRHKRDCDLSVDG